MKALSALSKYVGYYDKWKNIVECNQLKWSSEDTVETFGDVMMKR
jgi:hypothetical protein